VALVGLHGGEWFGASAGRALRQATVLVGAPRHLAALPDDITSERVELVGSLDSGLDRIAGYRDAGHAVCVVVSGDPGFFGLARLASARLEAHQGSVRGAPDQEPHRLTVHPAPSSAALAFARIGTCWDDACVVSVHGRPFEPAVAAVLAHPKVAVLTSPDHPPEALGSQLIRAGCSARLVAVVSRIGEPDETVWEGDAAGLAAGTFDAMSVVIFRSPDATDYGPGWSWGLPDDEYDHRDGMITKAEVRAIALGKLRIPSAGVLWDVGAGSGSIAVECARLCPGLRIYAVEQRPGDVARLRRNTAGTGVTVVEGEAPAALDALPDPDRVFVGGGGLAVLDAALDRLRPWGTVVATYAALDRAAAGAERLGHVVQIAVSRGVPIGAGGSVRLAAENPVFLCWGPAA